MKKIVSAAFVAALLCSAGAAQAQISFGPKVGVGLCNQTIKYSGSDADEKASAKDFDDNQKGVITPAFGVMLSARFGNLAIQPAVMYAQKGTSYKSTNSGVTIESTTRYEYIEVPVNLVYTTGGDKGFQVFAGPYIGFGIGGKAKLEISGTGIIDGKSESDIKFDGKESADVNDTKIHAKNPDFGINAGIGYLVSGIQIQLGYGLGLSNLAPNDSDDKETDYSVKNKQLQLSFSYLFNAN